MLQNNINKQTPWRVHEWKTCISCNIYNIYHINKKIFICHIYIYLSYHPHMSYGRNYLFGEYAFTKCGGSPIGYQGFGCSGHQHQNRSMRFTVWDDFICYMIENCRRASQDARVPFDSKCRYRYNYKIFECALVDLGYTYYRHLWKHEKEDSTFFGSQQGQQTMNFELCSKPFLPQSGM